MITNLIELSEFVVLIEESDEQEITFSECYFEKDTVGISFYGSGEVELDVNADDKAEKLLNKRGTAISFSGNNRTKFLHTISNIEPLRSISIFCLIDNLKKLPHPERDVYENGLKSLLKSDSSFEVGPITYMTPEMINIISKIFQNKYEGTAQVLFLKSQVSELLAHFFSLVTAPVKANENKEDTKKIMLAKDIITNNMEKPPSLNELSMLIGMNSNKLKKNFKEMFGIPVFKYLQEERLTKAHSLLRQGEMTVQEVAWFVGYESLSSFSNAFLKRFGFRPSDVLN
jgi:AraC family transcriptional activator of pyochelin receptor